MFINIVNYLIKLWSSLISGWKRCVATIVGELQLSKSFTKCILFLTKCQTEKSFELEDFKLKAFVKIFNISIIIFNIAFKIQKSFIFAMLFLSL